MLTINTNYKYSDFDNISSYKNWTDIRTLWVWKSNMDDISVLSQSAELEYIIMQDEFAAHDIQAIEQMLPYCKIVSY